MMITDTLMITGDTGLKPVFPPLLFDIYFIGTIVYQIWNLFSTRQKYFLYKIGAPIKK